MATQQQARVTLRVQRADETWRDCGVFKNKEGGDVTAEESKVFPGGMEPQVALATPRTVENVTLTKFARLTDTDLMRFLQERVGRASAVATVQRLDPDGNASGPPLAVYTGILVGFTPPEYDSSSTDPDEFQVEISTDGTIG